jgi:hypothetical protein
MGDRGDRRQAWRKYPGLEQHDPRKERDRIKCGTSAQAVAFLPDGGLEAGSLVADDD